LTFDQAKKQARAMLADAMRGADPVEIRRTARKAATIADLAADYLERHAVPKKRPESVRDYRAMLDNIILPKLGARARVHAKRLQVEMARHRRQPGTADRAFDAQLPLPTTAPEIAVADGALGFWKALGEVWPTSKPTRSNTRERPIA